MTEIIMPAEGKSRLRRPAVADDYGVDFITLHDAETAVQATLQHRGTIVDFSDDGINWVDAWVGAGDQHPSHARATVVRKYGTDDLVSTTVVVRWDEYVPDLSDDRRATWDKMPTVMLGKVAKVSAYRGGFRDVIGNRYEPAELDQAHRAPLAITA